ncbi:MAG: PAS domain S-box protein [Candidatus Cloacimonetes bacterium]|nr:PAS domain S-box protein [Candidatus Cloacimonadota bacterium]
MDRNKFKILAIDDNKDNLISLKALIREAFPQAEILTAKSGSQGLQIAAECDPDIILLDIVMPGMDGFEVCRKLKADDTLSEIPVIFITALKGEKESRIAALDAGGDAFLAKPIDESELTAQIRAMLKIRKAVIEKHDEKERLEKLIEERTIELQKTHTATLNLLEDLQMENQRRIKSEADLKASNKQFQQLIETLPISLSIVTIDGKILYVNPNCLDLYEVEDKIDRPEAFNRWVNPADRDKWLNEIKTNGSIQNFEMHMKTTSDKEIWTLGSGIFIQYEGQTCILSTQHDITEVKQVQDALRESEEKYRTLVNSTLQGVVIAQADPVRLSFANPAMTKISGYTSEELIGMEALELAKLIYEEDRQRFFSEFQKRIQGKDIPQDNEYRIETKDGKLKWVALYSSRIEYQNQPATLTTFMDITERKRAEEELKHSRERFKMLSNLTFEGILIHDNGIVIDINQSLLNMFNYSYQEVIGKNIFAIAVPKEFHQTIFSKFQSRSVDPYEIEAIKKNGSRFPIEIEAREVVIDGKMYRVAAIRDITERRKAEAYLKESEAKFRTLMEQAADGLLLHDLDGNIIEVNQASIDQYGYPREKLLSMNIREIDPDYDDREDKGNFYQKMDFNTPVRFEARQQRKNGEIFPTEVTLTKIKLNENVFIMGLCRDISRHKEAEEALKASEIKFRTLVDQASEMLFLHDLQGNLIEVNETAIRTTGYSREELEKMNVMDLDPDAHNRDDMHKYWLAMKPGDPPASFEGRHIRKDGSIYQSEITISKVAYWGHQHILGLARDITERKQAEEELRMSEEKYRSVVDNMTEGLFVLQGMKCVYANPAIQKISGLSHKEIGEKTILDVVHPADKEVIIRNYEMRLQGRNIPSYDFRIEKPNGEIRWLVINGSLISWKNEPAVLYFVSDITERKLMQLKQETLFKISEALNRTYDLTKLCYEIRTLLGQVIDTTNFYVALYDEKTDIISLPFDVDEKDEFIAFPAGKTLTKYVIKTAKPLLVNRSQQDEMARNGLIETIGAKSLIWMGVPLIVENKVIGMIALQSYDDPDLYSEEDIGILSFVSEEIALAIKRTQAEEHIRKSLEEKNLLLQELYHRTKNNMQVIASMLRMQARQIGSDRLTAAFQDIINKINSMALVHQKLYESNDLSSINLKEFIRELVNHLLLSYRKPETEITLDLDLHEIQVNIDAAIPLALVLSELISNIFKHAFPDESKGRIEIRLHPKGKEIVLELGDDGIGVKNNVNLRTMGSVGMKNVFMLIENQLNGRIDYQVSKGLKWVIAINDDLGKIRI